MRHWTRLLLALGLYLLSPLALTQPDNSAVGIVINQSVSQNNLTLLTLRSIFSQRKRSWDDGTPITVVVLPDEHPVHRKFCRTKLQIYPYVLRDHWDRLMFSGTGTAPRVAKSEAELKTIVSTTPGAIGYQSVPAGADDELPLSTLPQQGRSDTTGRSE
ncbi:hypothetical protein NCG89_02560 [Spongiibacter taiwanensis]|uniref:hypothetical protein n=1 Tax=Spongiibacter taiwanensis TaxID=1748242 RepID=UPI0020361A06|nr:hypothetical protein [Spongiibacter taiwanensis]USA43677.1 hypothetical protein NCG89_02560 [Spongiibacter taiwanensis]